MRYTFSEITDRTVWDAFLSETNSYSLFQSWTWGEVQEKLAQSVERYGCYDKDQLVAIFQIVIVNAKRGRFIHLRHGPVIQENRKEVWSDVILFLQEFAKKYQALFIRLSPLIDQSYATMLQELGCRNAEIHAMDAEHCWVLPLDKTEEELLKDMRKTTRYEIRKAETIGLSVTSSDKLEDLQVFLDLYQETSKRQGFVQHQGIAEEFECFSTRNEAILYWVEYESKPISAAIILFTGGQGIYHHGASIINKIPASYAIQWEAIKEAKRRGMKQYNFWGIAPDDHPNHPWQGLTLFKKGFGGEVHQFVHAQDIPVSPLYLIPSAIEKIRKIRKGY